MLEVNSRNVLSSTVERGASSGCYIRLEVNDTKAFYARHNTLYGDGYSVGGTFVLRRKQVPDSVNGWPITTE